MNSRATAFGLLIAAALPAEAQSGATCRESVATQQRIARCSVGLGECRGYTGTLCSKQVTCERPVSSDCMRAISGGSYDGIYAYYCDNLDSDNRSTSLETVLSRICPNPPAGQAPQQQDESSLGTGAKIALGVLGLAILAQLLGGDSDGETPQMKEASAIGKACGEIASEERHFQVSRAVPRRRSEICACVAERASRMLVDFEKRFLQRGSWGSWMAVQQTRLSRAVEPCAATVAEQADLVALSDVATWTVGPDNPYLSRHAQSINIDNRCNRSKVVYLLADRGAVPLGLFVPSGQQRSMTLRTATPDIQALQVGVRDLSSNDAHYAPFDEQHETLRAADIAREVLRWHPGKTIQPTRSSTGAYDLEIRC